MIAARLGEAGRFVRRSRPFRAATRRTGALPRTTWFMIGLAAAITALLLSTPGTHFDRRLADFKTIHRALEAHKRDRGAYPISTGVTVAGLRGPAARNWIPGLAPRYLDPVPTDPRMSDLPSLQYLYISDGVGYKLIAHAAEDVGRVTAERPDLIDPVRPAYAYGYWTKDAERW